METKKGSTALITLSVICAILAFLDALDVNVLFDATSWVAIAAVLGVWAVWLDVSCCRKIK